MSMPVYLITENRCYVRYKAGTPFNFNVWGPRPDSSLMIPCAFCGKRLLPGDYTSIEPVRPADGTPVEREQEWCSWEAQEFHVRCKFPEWSPE